MEPIKEEPPKITDQLKDYIETRVQLIRYQAIQWITALVANIVTDILVVICAFVTFLFALITLALLLGQLLGAYWAGFGIVTLLFLLLAFVIKKGKKKLIEDPLVNMLVNKIIKTKK